MTHTYRDPRAQGYGRSSALFLASMAVIVPAAWMTLHVLFDARFIWDDPGFLGITLGLPIVFAYLTHRHFSDGLCREIRLNDDGTCELETNRRVIRLHVNEIKSVKYRLDREDSRESYTIHYLEGKLLVEDRMTNFPDFVNRLRSLNPAVDLTSVPTDASWARKSESERSRPQVTIRSALFPVVVIGVLVWLAIQTFSGG